MNQSLSDRPAASGMRWLGPQIRLGPLINLLKRAALAHRAGIDIVKFWQKEALDGPRELRRACGLIEERLRSGDTLAAATAAPRGFFPPLVLEMIEVGDATGRLDEVLNRLHEHYDHLRDLRRSMVMGLIWPAVQFTIAVFIVGLLIWIPTFISGMRGGEAIDILGLGLVGTQGLVIYATLVLSLGAAIAFGILAYRQGWFGAGPVKLFLRIPVLGGCLRTAALARFSWTLALTLESGLDARRAMRMSLRSTQLPHVMAATERADEVILRGGEFHEACRAIDAFPDDFITALSAAEQGQVISESLHHLSKAYSEQARTANKVLTMFAGFAIWGGVACLLILLIFRLFSFYLGTLNEALDMASPGWRG